VAEGPCERCIRVSDGDGDEFHPLPILLGRRDEEGDFSVFSACFLSHPRSLQNPISMRMRMHVFLSMLVWPGSGVSGIPLDYMRSGVVPWPPSWRSCASSGGSTQGGIRMGAAVHSALSSEAVGPKREYIGSCETSVCRLMRVVSIGGGGSDQSPSVGGALSSTFSPANCVEQVVSRETNDV
jgi:hypothetical protein